MSVTTILFKRGASVPTGSNFAATVGEPLWHQDTENGSDLGHLYVTNGTNNPTLIGPIEATQYTHPTFTIPTGSNYTVTAGADGDQIVAAAANYAIGGFTVTSEGHVKDVSVVQIPQAVTPNDATLTIQKNGTAVGTFTANASQNATVNIEANKVEWSQTQQSGTPIATITIDGTATTVYAPTAGTPVQSVEEVYAKTLSGGTSAIVSTDPQYGTENQRSGVQTVTFKHDAQNSGVGSMATFVAGSPSNGNIDVTMSITVIDGGTW